MSQRKTIILGIGNLLLKDEGIGIHVIEALKKHALPENVELVDGSVLGFDLLPVIEDCRRIIVIDAIVTDDPPGTLYSFNADDIETESNIPISVHDFDFFQVLALARQTGKLPPTKIIAVVPHAVADGIELSPVLAAKLPAIIQLVLNTINKE